MPEHWENLSDDTRAARYAWPRGRWTRLNMIVSIDGHPVGHDGTSHTITNDHDRFLVRAVRNEADAIVLGAASIRAEGWFMPARGDLVVVTRSTRLPVGCPEPTRTRVVDRGDLEAAVSTYQHVLCEGGQTVAHAMITNDQIDQLLLTFVTTSLEPLNLPNWLAVEGRAWSCISDISDGTHRFTIWRRGEG
jgi:riboflavin biosynthesis pyrimidine reductase